MNRLETFWQRRRSLWQRPAKKREIDEELRLHMKLRTAENPAAVRPPEDAAREARKRFGNLQSILEECRDIPGASFGEATLQDLRFTLRTLWKSPGFTVVVVLTLALGIGASTAIYGALNALFLNPVPGPAPARLVQIAEGNLDSQGQPSFDGVSTVALELLRTNQDFFTEVAWFHSMRLETMNDDFSTAMAGEMVSPNFFKLLNSPPLLGRTFTKIDATPMNESQIPEHDSVIILNHSWWKSRFGGDVGIIGKTLSLSGRRFTVIGVMPEHFQFPRARESFWVPAEDPRPKIRVERLSEINVLARLRPGVTERQTKTMLDTVAQPYASPPAQLPLEHRRESHLSETLGFQVRPLCHHFPKNPGADNLQRTLFGLLGAMGFVLLIACLNVANLTLARTEKRQPELSIRAALGAGRFRLARQLLTESLALGLLGGFVGLGISVGVMNLLISLIPTNFPRMKEIAIDGRALGFTLLVSVIAAFVCGLAPTWHACRTGLGETLKQAGNAVTRGRGRRRFRGALVMAEVAFSLVLLAGAGLMIQSVTRLLRVNPGFDPEHLLYVNLWLPGKYSDSVNAPDANHARNNLLGHLHEQLAALPGIQAVGIYGGDMGDGEFVFDGRAEPLELDGMGSGVAESDFFRAMRIPLLAGRYFDKSDIAINGRAVIINEALARLCWPGENPVGKTFHSVQPAGSSRSYDVVGLATDTRLARYGQRAGPTFYRPYQNATFGGAEPSVLMVVRTERDPQLFIQAIRAKLKAVEPTLWNPRILIVRQALYESTQIQRSYMLYLMLFAGVGLLLSAMGIYGILAYSVANRTREIGIRIAMGANPHQVQGMIMAEGMRWVGVGVGIGLLAAFWLTRLLRSQLFEVGPSDPVVLATVIPLLCTVALLACFIPARRAIRINPVMALRCE